MSIRSTLPSVLAVICSVLGLQPDSVAAEAIQSKVKSYTWTTDHVHVGVRWQPFGLVGCDMNDANRPLISEHSSYVQFWVSWNAAEPTEKSRDYKKHPSQAAICWPPLLRSLGLIHRSSSRWKGY